MLTFNNYYFSDVSRREEAQLQFEEAVNDEIRERLTDMAEHYEDLILAQVNKRRRTLVRLLDVAETAYWMRSCSDRSSRLSRWSSWCRKVRNQLTGDA